MHSKKPPDTMAGHLQMQFMYIMLGQFQTKILVRIKFQQRSMLARAIENNPSGFPKDTGRQVNLVRS